MDIKYTKYDCYSCECFVPDTPDIKVFVTKKGIIHFCNHFCYQRKNESEYLREQIEKDFKIWKASKSTLPFAKWRSKKYYDILLS